MNLHEAFISCLPFINYVLVSTTDIRQILSLFIVMFLVLSRKYILVRTEMQYLYCPDELFSKFTPDIFILVKMEKIFLKQREEKGTILQRV